MTVRDADLQSLFDTANKALEAVYEDERNARKAIAALEQLHVSVAARLNELSRNVTSSIEASASKTAKEAAALLTQKFTEADSSADKAAKRYQRAANWAGWKLIVFALFLQVALAGGGWFFVLKTMPPQTEIEERRALVGQLSEQAAQRRQEVAELEAQLAQQRRKLADIDKRGARIEWSTCQDSEQRNRLCFRTDEREQPGQESERTYRIPWGY